MILSSVLVLLYARHNAMRHLAAHCRLFDLIDGDLFGLGAILVHHFSLGACGCLAPDRRRIDHEVNALIWANLRAGLLSVLIIAVTRLIAGAAGACLRSLVLSIFVALVAFDVF